jgi:hypothetical protein
MLVFFMLGEGRFDWGGYVVVLMENPFWTHCTHTWLCLFAWFHYHKTLADLTLFLFFQKYWLKKKIQWKEIVRKIINHQEYSIYQNKKLFSKNVKKLPRNYTHLLGNPPTTPKYLTFWKKRKRIWRRLPLPVWFKE